MHFNELKILHLNHLNGLKDIKTLCAKTFPKLKKLNIEGSYLLNDCFDVIKPLKLPKLKFLKK